MAVVHCTLIHYVRAKWIFSSLCAALFRRTRLVLKPTCGPKESDPLLDRTQTNNLSPARHLQPALYIFLLFAISDYPSTEE